MNDVQQFIVKPHSQSIEQQQYQATSECWNPIVDEGLLQVYTYSRTSRIIVLLYNRIKDVKRKISIYHELLNEFVVEDRKSSLFDG